jgi:beta-glucosidase
MSHPAQRDVAQLLLPAFRWDANRGWDGERARLDEALRLGVGGVLLQGGTVESVRALTKEIQSRTRTPLLVGADMERGAGQQFEGAAGLPPLAAIAALRDVDAVRRAARLTAREARTMGVNWDLAPVCDLDLVPDNPIVHTRSLGADPKVVGDLASEWIDACQSEGVLACAKHFPGHGRTLSDSHLELPVVKATARELHDTDLVPFRAAIDAGVGAIMTAHVAYPALDASGAPATLSREILQWLLRQQMKFDGLVLADALGMAGVRGGRDEAQVAVEAIRAGCDMLVAPEDVPGVVRALGEALASGQLDAERVHQSVRRRLKWAQWVSPPNDWRRPSLTDVAWGAQLCDRVVQQVRGAPRPLVGRVEVVVVDDDAADGTRAGSRDWLAQALRAAGRDVKVVDGPGPDARAPLVVALFGDVLEGKGRVGYGEASLAAVARAVEAARTAARDAIVVQFGHPRLAPALAGAEHVVCAWCGDRAMQEAAARWLLKAR